MMWPEVSVTHCQTKPKTEALSRNVKYQIWIYGAYNVGNERLNLKSIFE